MRLIATLLLSAVAVSAQKLPDLHAKDQNGRPWSLGTFLGPKGGLLIVAPSANAKEQLADADRSLSKLEALGLRVAGLSTEPATALRGFAEREGLRIPLVSDPDAKIIKALSMLTVGAPTPKNAVYVLDSGGTVTGKYLEKEPEQRYTISSILFRQFGKLDTPAQGVFEGKQLTATAFASSSTIRPGERVTLVLEVEIKPKMHVYAPGAQGYLPIEWKLSPQPATTAGAADLPKSEVWVMPLTQEKVPVYSGHIVLSRDVVLLPGQRNLKDFVIEGTLNYQACDDSMCYFPQQLAVKWALAVPSDAR